MHWPSVAAGNPKISNLKRYGVSLNSAEIPYDLSMHLPRQLARVT